MLFGGDQLQTFKALKDVSGVNKERASINVLFLD